jgi:hypothetical protein
MMRTVLLKVTFFLSIIILCLLLPGCGVQPTQASMTTEVPTEIKLPPTIPQQNNQVEITAGVIPNKEIIGNLNIQYPVKINSASSKTISLHINIPAELASLDNYQVDARQPDNPHPLGKYSDFSTLILVSAKMRVELIAPNFTIQALYPSEQILDISSPNPHADWGWTVTAPKLPNEYVLVVRIFIAENPVPSWVGSFDVEVTEPAALPTPAPTSKPYSERILEDLANNAVTLIGALLTTIVAVLGLYFQNRKTKTGKK